MFGAVGFPHSCKKGEPAQGTLTEFGFGNDLADAATQPFVGFAFVT